jgi:hypothetical protein
VANVYGSYHSYSRTPWLFNVIREFSVRPWQWRSVGIRADPKRQVMVRSRKMFVTSEADVVIQTMRAQTKMTVNTNEKRVPTVGRCMLTQG